MATATLNDCTQLDTTILERVNYFPRQLLTADDMTTDQQYFLNKLRRHNRYLHGWGVVCGLEVSAAPTATNPWQIQIGPGYALGPYGDEIFVPNPVMLDLAQCGPGASTDPCDPGSLLQGGTAKNGSVLFLAIRYEECLARPVRVLPGGCGCNDSACEPSRINDSYEIECLADLPPSGQPAPDGPSMCDILNGQALPQCPPCPTDPWVVLAQVRLPGNTGTAVAQSAIDAVTVRRKLFSTAMIQEQVRLCCCAGTDKAPARVTSINPAGGTVFTDASTVPPVLVVTFDKHLVASSVSTSTILVTRTSNAVSKSLQGIVTYDDGLRSAQFTPAEAFTIPGTYFVTVVGSGPVNSFIVDSDNLALDGNDDSIPGGNFVSQFSVVTTSPTGTPTPTPSSTPTPTSPPINIVVAGPVQVPDAVPRNPSVVGPLTLTVTGGTQGKKFKFDVTVTLSQNIGKSTDTAQWNDDAGNSVAAKKGTGAAAAVYTFTGVIIPEPGPGKSVNVTISNMKIDASKLAVGNAPTNVTAFAAFTSDTVLSVTSAPQIVARVLLG